MSEPRVEIEIAFKPPRFLFSKPHFRLTVRDEGFGFSPEQEARLFKRFSRLEIASEELKKHSVPGTGLGLYLSASACKAMNLTLTGESRGEKMGAVFVIEGRTS